MIERYWPAVPPVAFTASGTSKGLITITSTAGFFVKQHVQINHPTLPYLTLQVKRISSSTQMYLGPIETDLKTRSDLTQYDSTSIASAKEQGRPAIPLQEIERAVYQEEPGVALRTLPVDQFGQPYSATNPLPVELNGAEIKIDNLNAQLDVHLSAKDNDPKAGDLHASIRVGDGVNELAVNADGSLNVNFVQSGAPALLVSFNSVSAVATGAETTLISKVTPPGGFRLMKVDVSGENVALFSLKVDGVTLFTKRSWWNNWNQEFRFEDFQNGLRLTQGQVLSITVLHNRPSPANYEVTVMGL